MNQLYEQALTTMEGFVNRLAKRVPSPRRVRYKESFVFRHVEELMHQAID